MHTTKSRKLIGPVHTVESEFAVFDTVDGNTIETRHEQANFERYDRDGRLLEEISAERMLIDQVYRDVYLYNTNGDLIEHQEYEDHGVLLGKQVFEPGSDDGRISKSYYVGWNKELVLSSLLLFDNQGEMVEVTHFDETGNVLPKSPNSTFNKNTITTLTEQIDEFTFQERRFKSDGSPSTSIVRSYDINGNEMEFSCIEPNGKLSIKEVYEYEFDAMGNWTSKKSYRWVIGWGEFHLYPYTITRRRIVYC